MQFTIHSKSRAPLKKPTLEITKHNQRAIHLWHNRFKKERVKNIDKEKNRYEVKLVLTKVLRVIQVKFITKFSQKCDF